MRLEVCSLFSQCCLCLLRTNDCGAVGLCACARARVCVYVSILTDLPAGSGGVVPREGKSLSYRVKERGTMWIDVDQKLVADRPCKINDREWRGRVAKGRIDKAAKEDEEEEEEREEQKDARNTQGNVQLICDHSSLRWLLQKSTEPFFTL